MSNRRADRPLSRVYDRQFTPDARYLEGMPDLQHGDASTIRGAHQPIQHVGISGVRLPVVVASRNNGTRTCEARVSATVSLGGSRKGAHLSRVQQVIQTLQDDLLTPERLAGAATTISKRLESRHAHIRVCVSWPQTQKSLRSGLEGLQYYDFALECHRAENAVSHAMHLDYLYSSLCPCSLELSEHARHERHHIAAPHSQRSRARIAAEICPGEALFVDDLIAICRRAIPTETQVMVKREDEQAFAELNAANPIFVEDAVRLLFSALKAEKSVGDFRIVATHEESLHSHDAVAVLNEGARFSESPFDYR